MRNISMQDLNSDELKGRPIYVLNTARESIPAASAVGADVSISVGHSNGSSSMVLVPCTNIPVELTASVPARDLLENSPSFFAAVRKGHVKLLHPDDAEEQLSTDDAQYELRRLSDVADRKSADQQITTKKGKPVVYGMVQDDSIKMGTKDFKTEVEVSPNFIGFINSLNSKDIKEAKALLLNRGNFTEPEAHYLVANCTHESLVKAVKSRLG